MSAANVHAGYADVNGARLYYERAGSGPPVVLLHAGVADHRMWDPQHAAFAARYQVIRFDLRGFGRSTLPPGPFAMRDDLYALLRQLGVTSAHLVGCSMGGSTAIDFTLEHPEMVRSLILVASGIGGRKASPALLVMGDEDVPDVLEGVDLLAAHLPRAQRLVIPNAAHMVSMERPDAFNRAALDFLAAVEAA